MIYVGRDVSLNCLRYARSTGPGRLFCAFDCGHLEPWTSQVERVGLEAGPTSEWLTRINRDRGFRPLVCPPGKAVLSAMPVTTDWNDARGIAQLWLFQTRPCQRERVRDRAPPHNARQGMSVEQDGARYDLQAREVAEKSWPRVNGHKKLPKLSPCKFADGIEVARPQTQSAAA